MIRVVVRAVRALFTRGARERELSHELQFHIDKATEQNVARGMSPAEARRQALIAFGSVEATKEAHRDGRGARWIEDVLADVRYALGQMRRSPAFSAVVITVLAIGIGVNSAVISFVDDYLTQRAPGVPERDRLVSFNGLAWLAYADGMQRQLDEIREFRERQRVFEFVAHSMQRSVVTGTGATRDRQHVSLVSGDYFAALRPRMALGTAFTGTDDVRDDVPTVAVISHSYWQTALGGDTSIVGQTLTLNGVPFRIVGVLPRGFVMSAQRGGPEALWIPFASWRLVYAGDSAIWPRGGASAFQSVARMRDGVTLKQAAAATASIGPTLSTRHTDRERKRLIQIASLYSLGAEETRFFLLLGLGISVVTGLILAIACANVSILLLGRAVARRREIAVRLSLGASRARIVRQLVTESAVLAVLASVGGLLILWAGSGVIRSQFSELGSDLSPSWRTAVISIALAVGTGVLFGLLPAFHATRSGVASALKDSVAGLDRRRSRLQRAFVVAEVAMSVALISATGLFADAAYRSASAQPEYEISRSVLTGVLPLSLGAYTSADADALLVRIRERLGVLPGVASVSAGAEIARGSVAAQDSATSRRWQARVATVDPSYFATRGIPLRAGREINVADLPGATPIAIINDDLANRLWPGAVPIGRSIKFGQGGANERLGRDAELLERESYTVVGVVASARDAGNGDVTGAVYLSRRQKPTPGDINLYVRTNQSSPLIAQRVIDELRAIEPTLPLRALQSTRQLRDVGSEGQDAAQAGLGAALVGVFALGLACVGLFAVVAFGVAQRTREIGIRVALGATPTQVVRGFFRDGMRLALIGLAAGIPLGIGGMKFLNSKFFGTSVLGVVPLVAIVSMLLVVAAVASWLPARRAASVDPLDALRSE